MADLPERMHARVRPARGRNAGGRAEEFRSRPLEFALHGAFPLFLPLPARKQGAVVPDEKDVSHKNAPTYTRSRTTPVTSAAMSKKAMRSRHVKRSFLYFVRFFPPM